MFLNTHLHLVPPRTFNGAMPGPFIRARVGDVLEVRHKNNDMSGMAHNVSPSEARVRVRYSTGTAFINI